jgi:hypothetical protein
MEPDKGKFNKRVCLFRIHIYFVDAKKRSNVAVYRHEHKQHPNPEAWMLYLCIANTLRTSSLARFKNSLGTSPSDLRDQIYLPQKRIHHGKFLVLLLICTRKPYKNIKRSNNKSLPCTGS